MSESFEPVEFVAATLREVRLSAIVISSTRIVSLHPSVGDVREALAELLEDELARVYARPFGAEVEVVW